jgi:hypothetical protein
VLVALELPQALQALVLQGLVVVGVATMLFLLEQRLLAALGEQAVAVLVETPALVVLRVQQTLVVAGAVVVHQVLPGQQAATAALALSSLKCLTTYPQHSLVALHRACPHPVGSTSTL